MGGVVDTPFSLFLTPAARPRKYRDQSLTLENTSSNVLKIESFRTHCHLGSQNRDETYEIFFYYVLISRYEKNCKIQLKDCNFFSHQNTTILICSRVEKYNNLDSKYTCT